MEPRAAQLLIDTNSAVPANALPHRGPLIDGLAAAPLSVPCTPLLLLLILLTNTNTYINSLLNQPPPPPPPPTPLPLPPTPLPPSNHTPIHAGMQLYLAWMAYFYLTMALRECVLLVNGSQIRSWWVQHHYWSARATRSRWRSSRCRSRSRRRGAARRGRLRMTRS